MNTETTPPHRSAVAATWLFPNRYDEWHMHDERSAQPLGAVGFFETLTKSEKILAEGLVKEVLESPDAPYHVV